MPDDNIWPFVTTLALSALFLGMLRVEWWLIGGGTLGLPRSSGPG